MSEPRPGVVILAGPNGAGKSTVAPALLHGALGVDEFVNADVIAQGLSAFEPDRVAIAAGRIMLARLNELAAQRADFAFETTLATRSFARWLRGLRLSGYDVHLFFLWLFSADLAVARVADRVGMEGHQDCSPSIFGWDSQLLPPVPTPDHNMGDVQHLRTSACPGRGGFGVGDDRGLR